MIKPLACLLLTLALLLGSHSSADAQSGNHAVKGRVTKNGTYVAPHRATNPNRTKADNWSTRGNVNPYTGKAGTQSPYKAPRASSRPRL